MLTGITKISAHEPLLRFLESDLARPVPQGFLGLEFVMFANIVWSAWRFFSGSAFRLGMWFVRLSSYRLIRSSGVGYSNRWSITHWSDDKIPLDKENYDKYSEFILTLLWFAAEPDPKHAGYIPLHQHAFIVQLVSSHWSGGRAAATVALIDEVMAANDIVCY